MEHQRRAWFGRGAWVLVGVTWLMSAPRMAAAQARAPSLEEITAKIEAWTLTVLDSTAIPAISMAVVRNGEVAWAGAWGVANVATGSRATPDTYFSTGSTFKAVTAAAVMQLVERGDISLDSGLNEIVGSEMAIPGADGVTLRHLLSHQAGLQVPLDRERLWGRVAPIGVPETFSRTKLVNPPGEEQRYCNGCYVLLEYVIEKVSGMPYDQYVASNILRPLGIDVSSASIPDPQVVEHLAMPYVIQDGVATATDLVRFNGFAPGDAYLRPSDMAAFLAAQLDGGRYQDSRILDESSVREMQREQFPGSGYGLGLMMRELSGHDVVHHEGSIPGFKAVMLGDVAAGVGVYVMANATQAEHAINILAWYTMMLLWGEETDPPPH